MSEPWSRVVFLVAAPLLASCFHGCSPIAAKPDCAGQATAENSPDGDDGPWWRLPEPELQEYVRQQIAEAEQVKLDVWERVPNMAPKPSPHVIRAAAEIKKLSDDFEIASARRPAPLYDTPVVIEVEVVGLQTTHFVLIGEYFLYGPWVPDPEARRRLWRYEVTVSRQFARDFEQHAGAKLLYP